MPLSSGTTLGPYEIQAPLGAGGQGEVYKARDTRLDRIVAIKVLPEHVASDPDLKQRFEREAKTISSLNHPHICTLYDIGSQDGVDFLVMEYLEGDTLAQRLEKGALPLDQALQVAIEIADALDKAHRQGITHRDLKPGNIMLTKAGAKLLDFGLAKLKPSHNAPVGVSAPTVSAGLTGEGAILGTLQYMAPEQLEGKEADARTDIFAFGTTVHEMATGKKAFEGTSQASLIGAILKDEARPISALQPLSPPALDRVVKRCMAKDADDRWQTARDLHSELRWVAEGGPQVGAPVSAPTAHPVGWRHLMPMVATGGAAALITGWTGYAHVILGWQYASPVRGAWAAAALMTGGAVWCLMRGWRHAMPYLVGVAVGGLVIGVTVWGVTRPAPPPARPLVQFVVNPPPAAPLQLTGVQTDVAISPYGTQIAYMSNDTAGNIGRRLYLRNLDQLEPTRLQGTERARKPFFSPDGQWVGFEDSVDLAVKKVLLSGGPAQTITTLRSSSRGFSWGSDGTIVFASQTSKGLMGVSEGGGEPEVLTRVSDGQGETDHFHPDVLPGGRTVLFTAWSGSYESSSIALLSRATGEVHYLFTGGSDPRYSATGHIIYAAAGTLWAVEFDLAQLEVTGNPVRLLDVMTKPLGAANFDLSLDGSLVYVPSRTDAGDAEQLLVLVDRDGREEPLSSTSRDYNRPRVSPEGGRIVVEDRQYDVWVLGLARSTETRITRHPAQDRSPLWTPSGERIVFSSPRDGAWSLFSIAADGGGDAEPLLTIDNARDLRARDWSPNGDMLVFEYLMASGPDVGVFPIDRDGEWQPLLDTAASEQSPAISPNGLWIAYVSNDTGQEEVYVDRFPELGDKRPISTNGGSLPVWSPNGNELFYRSPDGFVAVQVDPATLRLGRAEILFANASRGAYDVIQDGKQFLMVRPVAGDTVTPAQIVLIQNWFDELQRLVPTP